MNKLINARRGRRSKSTSFNPNKDFVRKATEDFLKHGGKITRVVDLAESFDAFVNTKEAANSADEFLMGS